MAARRSLLEPQASSETARGAPLFALAFRPFFLLAGALATLLVPVWLFAFLGGFTLPARLYPIAWHGHEMVFGFATAVIAGFLLTAARNWTNVQTVSGAPLAMLVVLFVAARVMLFFGIRGGAAVDVAFLPAIAVALAIPIVKKKNWRNLAFVPMLLVLAGCNAWFHATGSLLPLHVAIDVIIVIIAVMGGRVIPMFTANGAKVEVKRWLDTPAIVATVAVAIAEPFHIGAISVVAGVLNLLRMRGWQSWSTRRFPILWVLHCGYAFVGLGLILRGLSPTPASLHALAAGAIGVLILGMITRVSLGHTGRMLIVPTSIAIGYGLVVIAALVRTLGPLITPSMYRGALIVSGVAWTIAFAIFTLVYAPILLSPRVDGKPG